MVCREYMSRIAAEHVSLKGLSVLRNTIPNVQDEHTQERNKAALRHAAPPVMSRGRMLT